MSWQTVLLNGGLGMMISCGQPVSINSGREAAQNELSLNKANPAKSEPTKSFAPLAPPPGAVILSGFFGGQNAPPVRGLSVCGLPPGAYDGLPVVFGQRISSGSLGVSDFQVTMSNGQVAAAPLCATLAPANEPNETYTVLLVGTFSRAGGVVPNSVSVIGDLLTESGINLRGQSVAVTPLAAGPSIVMAQRVRMSSAELGSETGTLLTACPAGTTKNIVRLVWQGGVTANGVAEITDTQRQRYQVTVRSGAGTNRLIVPFAIADLNDMDNNQDLCLDTEDLPVSVFVPAGTVADPTGDLNPDTTKQVSPEG